MRAWHKYRRTYMLGVQNEMEYRTDFLLGILSGTFIVIVQCFLWTAVFNSSPQEVINGYTYPQMIIYSVFSGVVSRLVSAGFEGEVSNDIKTGGLSKFIAQPIHYFTYRICNFLGGKTVQLAIILLMMAAMVIFFMQVWDFRLEALRTLLFFASIVLGMLINFLLFYSISALAFVVTEVWGIFIAFNQGVYLLSGAIFPLDIFGDTVTRISSLLPFQYIVFFPVNILNGSLAQPAILNGLLVQVVWLGVLLIVSRVCWAAGMKKYVAVGG
ncbi:hypothetical protein PA598K_04149 [Paenibacillus sp. 598K]|uniref:ABC transporter permease n=1 Tax=Paenibacillus sp. 598K TaxID=1117987 RepID=UPI000FF96BD0|nr:ABC-2 family transporter protein [Paenibacillus sp. 598K]GBF75721.1 hypothetical protein PA598K_04149 [Paenibacillus sp. 598K]